MNISSSANKYTSFKLERSEAMKILESSAQRVTFGEHEFSTRSEAIDAIGKSVELPCGGLTLTQSATSPQAPEARRKHLEKSARNDSKLGFVVSAASIVTGVAALINSGPPTWLALTFAGAGLAIGGLTAHQLKSDISKAEKQTGPDRFTMVENRIQEHILPQENGEGFNSIGRSQEINHYRIRADKEDDNILIFDSIHRGHLSALSGPQHPSPIYDIQDGEIKLTSFDGSTF